MVAIPAGAHGSSGCWRRNRLGFGQREAPIIDPLAKGARNCCFCCSVPNLSMGTQPTELCTLADGRAGTIACGDLFQGPGVCHVPVSLPPYCSGTSMPNRPRAAISSMASRGSDAPCPIARRTALDAPGQSHGWRRQFVVARPVTSMVHLSTGIRRRWPWPRTADADGRHAAVQVVLAQGRQQRHQNPGARSADRVAQRTRRRHGY